MIRSSDQIRWRRALVTGASSGLGAEFARALAARGADLVVVARSTDRLEALGEEVDTDVEVITADLTDTNDVARVAARVRADQGPVDLVVNNAGFGRLGKLANADIDRVAAQIDIHVAAVLALTHAAVATFVPRGHGGVLNVASVAAFQPQPRGATYAACKAFIVSLTEAVHLEVRGTGVHVTCVCPGFTDTPMLGDASSIPAPLLLEPQKVVHEALAGLDADRPVVVPGLAWKATAALSSALPRSLVRRIVARPLW